MMRRPPRSTLFPYTRSSDLPHRAPCRGTSGPRHRSPRRRQPPWAQTQSVPPGGTRPDLGRDRKSTRLNSSHLVISYAVFCLKKKKIPDHLLHLDITSLLLTL